MPIDPNTIIAIMEALLKFAPQVPEIIEGVETVIASIKSGNAPSADDQVKIDAMLDASHAQFQEPQP